MTRVESTVLTAVTAVMVFCLLWLFSGPPTPSRAQGIGPLRVTTIPDGTRCVYHLQGGVDCEWDGR